MVRGGSSSEEADIHLYRDQLVLWGYPYLQRLIRESRELNRAAEELKACIIMDQLTIAGVFKEENYSKESPPDPCSICFEEFKEGEMLRQVAVCGHLFHS